MSSANSWPSSFHHCSAPPSSSKTPPTPLKSLVPLSANAPPPSSPFPACLIPSAQTSNANFSPPTAQRHHTANRAKRNILGGLPFAPRPLAKGGSLRQYNPIAKSLLTLPIPPQSRKPLKSPNPNPNPGSKKPSSPPKTRNSSVAPGSSAASTAASAGSSGLSSPAVPRCLPTPKNSSSASATP